MDFFIDFIELLLFDEFVSLILLFGVINQAIVGFDKLNFTLHKFCQTTILSALAR